MRGGGRARRDRIRTCGPLASGDTHRSQPDESLLSVLSHPARAVVSSAKICNLMAVGSILRAGCRRFLTDRRETTVSAQANFGAYSQSLFRRIVPGLTAQV
jgi:hypothetical protein